MAPKPIDILGQRFGRLYVVRISDKRPGKERAWVCKCDCGKETLVPGSRLRGGLTESCGCTNREPRGIKTNPEHDLTGQRFGRWMVESRDVTRRTRGVAYWRVRCDCGTYGSVPRRRLVRGFSLSCGCAQREGARVRFLKHDASNHELGGVWRSMLDRCGNPKSAPWKDYGGREISVCARWSDSSTGFAAFVADMGPRPSRKHQIERNNNDGNYEPTNCRWATIDEQAHNRRSSRFVELNGRRMVLAEAARALGMSWSGLAGRLDRNVPTPGLTPITPARKKAA